MAPMAFAPNPFDHQIPIRDHRLFFDRDSDVRKVLTRLQKGQSVSVVGKEKIGKTSLLHYVSTPQVATRHSFVPHMHFFFYVDCKLLADLGEDGCFRHIKAIVGKTVSTGKVPSAPALNSIASSKAYHWLEQAFFLFETQNIQPILQLDNFDWLATNARLGRRFFDNLRALSDAYDTLAFLTTSRVPLVDLEREIPRITGSPFFNIFRKFELQPFSPYETRRFLEKRLNSAGAVFRESVLEFLSDLSQGEPCRLQLAGSCAYDVWCENACSLSEEHCGEIERRFSDAL
jgi:hypothetical protein